MSWGGTVWWMRRRPSLPHEQHGLSALMRAAEFGFADCVLLLLNAGADKEAKSNVRMHESVVPWCPLLN